MWNSIRNLKTCEIGLRGHLGEAERTWLLREIASKHGVEYAVYDPAGSSCLIVEYDADLLNPLDVVDFLNLCGVYPDPAVPALLGGSARTPSADYEPMVGHA